MPMSSALTAPTMKSSTKCTRTRTSLRASIFSCVIGNTPTTACALTSPSPTSPHWNSSPVGKTIRERQSVTNLLDEYTIVKTQQVESNPDLVSVGAQGQYLYVAYAGS